MAAYCCRYEPWYGSTLLFADKRVVGGILCEPCLLHALISIQGASTATLATAQEDLPCTDRDLIT